MADNFVVAFVKAEMNDFMSTERDGMTEGLPAFENDKIVINVMLSDNDGADEIAGCSGVRIQESDHD